MDVTVVMSSLSLLVAGAALLWNRHTWRAARKTDVRVMAWHDASGLDVFLHTGSAEVEQVIAVRVFNHGEQPEYVMWIGVESAAGEPLVDDRPTAVKMVDNPPPVSRQVPPRGQLAAKFKLPPDVTTEGFVGYAVLGTGERVYSVPAMPDSELAGIHSEILEIIADAKAKDQT